MLLKNRREVSAICFLDLLPCPLVKTQWQDQQRQRKGHGAAYRFAETFHPACQNKPAECGIEEISDFARPLMPEVS